VSALSERTADIYQRHAARFDAERAKILFERAWLDRFLEHLPPSGAVLDLGCGAGEPIARYLIDRGCDLTGIDIAPAMIDLARARFPQADWRVADMRDLALGRVFDGVIGWHSFFHLTGDEQRACLARLADHLAPGGALMLTVGHAAGETTGCVAGEPVYHASLSPEDYEEILTRLGLRLINFVAEDPDCDFATILLAQRPDAPA